MGIENNGKNGNMAQLNASGIAEMILSLIAVILGALYLTTDWIPVGVILPIYAVLFTAIPVMRLRDIKKSGEKKGVMFVTSIFYLILAAVVIVATIVYFVKY